MTPPFDANRFTRTAVILAWTIGFMWLLGQGHFTAFLRPGLAPFVVLGLVLLALFLVASGFRPASAAAAAGKVPLRMSLLLLLPLAYLALGSTAPLGSYAYGNRRVGAQGQTRTSLTESGANSSGGTGAQAGSAAAPDAAPPGSAAAAPGAAVAAGPPKSLNLRELLEDGDQYIGHRVVLEGMVYSDAQTPAGQFTLFRFVVTCCVADAQGIGVNVIHPQAAALARVTADVHDPNAPEGTKDTWVRVEGVVGAQKVGDDNQLYIHADHVEPIKRPRSPYLQPF